jgi:hypothetical protein
VVVCGDFPVVPGLFPVWRAVSSGSWEPEGGILAAKRGENVVIRVVNVFFRW